MNYLRGALNAASQYYKDLPPINPATLTGAVDVIVIERRNEQGDIELACSPFHVRFGKWQVLRPAEKQVTVLLNGRSIPFNMKIGDAGEAFFVFETEEDVPDDLITSPLLQPIQDTPDHPPDQSGRFGAREDKPTTPLLQISPQEPEFLDLNSPQDRSTAPEQLRDTPPPRVDIPHHIEESSTAATVSAIRNTATTVRDVATNIPRLVRSGLVSGSSSDISPSKKSETASDLISPREDIQAPDVTYHRDVVLDFAGYHAKTPSGQTVTADEKWDENSDTKDSSVTSPDPTRTPTPEYPVELSDSLHPPRSTSAPPEYGGPSTSPPPEYSWDWTALPQRSPPENKIPFPPLARKRHEHRTSRLSSQSQRHSRSRSPIPEAEGGKLNADPDDPYKIWLDFEGQRLSFELSLCGEDEGRGDGDGDGDGDSGNDLKKTRRGITANTATDSDSGMSQLARRFEANRIAFRTLLDDEDVLHSGSIVARWDDEYIFRSDNSPLMLTLSKWRRHTLAEEVQRRSPETEVIHPVTSTPSLSTTTISPTIEPAVKSTVRSRTWSRWWSRSYVSDDVVGQQRQQLQQLQPKVQAKSVSTPVSASASVDKLVSPSSVPTRAATPDPNLLPPPSSVPFPQQQAPPPHHGKKYAKTLRLTSDQLKTLNLNKGANSITFSLSATGQVACTARIFMWDSLDQVVVSDIDGTITKSDALGHVFTLIGRDWTHLGVAKLYSDISRNGYKIMYLTSRAIGQADSTRDYLRSINQNNYQLPEGPVIMSPDRLLTSLHREVIMRKPEVFKMACLKDIRRLFGTTSQNVFYAGFGNRITDALSYRSVDIPSARIFTIDSSGELKMELLELAGYKSSYIHMTDLVDQMFPPINRKWAPEYTDFNYWRVPISDIELPELLLTTPSFMPPSPSLSASARSDVSVQRTLDRLRNFSLGRSASVSPRALSPDGSAAGRSSSNGVITPKDTQYDHTSKDTTITDYNNNNNNNTNNTNTNNKHVRSAVSLDRLGSFLPSLGSTDAIPSYRRSTKEGEREGEGQEEVVFVPKGWGTNGYRKSRPGSMPGSLELTPSIQNAQWFENGGDSGDERGDDKDDYSYHDGYAEEQVAEQTFDDDLIATGEMENVPYL